MDNRVTWHPVILPSLGVYYGGKCPEGKVEITPWTTVQEELFIRYGGAKPTELIGKLIQGNVRLPAGMKHEEMLITDRFFLLFQLRSISLVPQYSFTHTCSKCKTEHQISINIGELKVRTPDSDDPEPFEVKLPRCGKTVHVRLMRCADETAMDTYEQEVLKKVQDPGSPAHRFKLARQIEKIDGQTAKFEERIDFVKNLIWRDLNQLRRVLDQHETGFIMDLETACPRGGCGNVDKWTIPFEDTFFRPLDVDFEGEAGPPQEPGA